ncbi:MAG: hypothetical protein DHS20C06_00760 [Hyphobacterium sp.]|nr:MAG: hypothetical protein DHS20C06_00760 [Hyphobacterium sp.]
MQAVIPGLLATGGIRKVMADLSQIIIANEKRLKFDKGSHQERQIAAALLDVSSTTPAHKSDCLVCFTPFTISSPIQQHFPATV